MEEKSVIKTLALESSFSLNILGVKNRIRLGVGYSNSGLNLAFGFTPTGGSRSSKIRIPVPLIKIKGRYQGEIFIDNNSNEKYDEGEIFIDAITNNIYDYLNSDQYEDWTDCNNDFSICEDHDNWDDETMGNHFWNEGETWIDEGANETYDPEDEFIDKVELDNSKLTLKFGLQYKIPEPNITIGLNLNYAKAVDHLKTEQDDPVFKAKMAIKFGF